MCVRVCVSLARARGRDGGAADHMLPQQPPRADARAEAERERVRDAARRVRTNERREAGEAPSLIGRRLPSPIETAAGRGGRGHERRVEGCLVRGKERGVLCVLACTAHEAVA